MVVIELDNVHVLYGDGASEDEVKNTRAAFGEAGIHAEVHDGSYSIVASAGQAAETFVIVLFAAGSAAALHL